ncbi:MAG: hypothetical protein AB7G21_04685 [Dehalococcoidia bacterium]
MTSRTRQRAQLVLAVLVAAAMIGSAYFRIGPEHTWLYLVGVWAIISAAFEVTGRSKDPHRG